MRWLYLFLPQRCRASHWARANMARLLLILACAALTHSYGLEESEMPDDSSLEGYGEWCQSWKNLICGTNGVTYWNECLFLKARDKFPSLEVSNPGACQRPLCNCPMGSRGTFICANNNYVFTSECAYRCYLELFPQANETYKGCRTVSPSVQEMESASPELIKRMVTDFINVVLPHTHRMVRRDLEPFHHSNNNWPGKHYSQGGRAFMPPRGFGANFSAPRPSQGGWQVPPTNPGPGFMTGQNNMPRGPSGFETHHPHNTPSWHGSSISPPGHSVTPSRRPDGTMSGFESRETHPTTKSGFKPHGFPTTGSGVPSRGSTPSIPRGGSGPFDTHNHQGSFNYGRFPSQDPHQSFDDYQRPPGMFMHQPDFHQRPGLASPQGYPAYGDPNIHGSFGAQQPNMPLPGSGFHHNPFSHHNVHSMGHAYEDPRAPIRAPGSRPQNDFKTYGSEAHASVWGSSMNKNKQPGSFAERPMFQPGLTPPPTSWSSNMGRGRPTVTEIPMSQPTPPWMPPKKGFTEMPKLHQSPLPPHLKHPGSFDKNRYPSGMPMNQPHPGMPPNPWGMDKTRYAPHYPEMPMFQPAFLSSGANASFVPPNFMTGNIPRASSLAPFRGALQINSTLYKFSARSGWMKELTVMNLPDTFFISSEKPGRIMFRVIVPQLELGYDHFLVDSGMKKVNSGIKVTIQNVAMVLTLDLVQENPVCTRLLPVTVRVMEFPQRITSSRNESWLSNAFNIPPADLEDFMKEKLARYINQALLHTVTQRMRHVGCLSFIERTPTPHGIPSPIHCIGAFQNRYCST